MYRLLEPILLTMRLSPSPVFIVTPDAIIFVTKSLPEPSSTKVPEPLLVTVLLPLAL